MIAYTAPHRCKEIEVQIKLVVPAIYRLSFPGAQGDKWGWHLASNLFEAANNMRSLAEVPLNPLTPYDMGREYAFADPMSYSYYFLIAVPKAGGKLEIEAFHPARCRWLEEGIKLEAYFPAKIGMLLLNGIKNPAGAKVAATVRKFASV